jgi:hypothetical protein
MATTWGVTALKQIVANMHIWASRILRPKVSEFIGLCRKNRDLEILSWNVDAITRTKDKDRLRNERPRRRTRQSTRPRPSSTKHRQRFNVAPQDNAPPIDGSNLSDQESSEGQSNPESGPVTNAPHVLHPNTSLQLHHTMGHQFSFEVFPFHQYRLSDNERRWAEHNWGADGTC